MKQSRWLSTLSKLVVDAVVRLSEGFRNLLARVIEIARDRDDAYGENER